MDISIANATQPPASAPAEAEHVEQEAAAAEEDKRAEGLQVKLDKEAWQLRAVRNAADESLPAKEREAWEIASRVDWSDLLPEGGGVEIRDTARRAISLDHLRYIVAHIWRRIKRGETWVASRPDAENKGAWIEYPIETVDQVSHAFNWVGGR